MIKDWEFLTFHEISDLARRDPLAILLAGSTEQHGSHLPLATDSIIGNGILERSFRHIPDENSVVRLPDLSIGVSLEHTEFPGTISYSTEVLIPMVVELGRQVVRAGIRRLLIVNSHGGNSAALDIAGMKLHAEGGLSVAKVDYFRFPRPKGIEFPENEWTHGFHGGATETSMMMHLRPDLVKPEKFCSNTSKIEEMSQRMRMIGRDRAVSLYWMADDIHESGTVGDATLSSDKIGQQLLEHYGKCLSQVMLDMKELDMDDSGR